MQDHGFFDSDGIWNSENPQMFKQFLAKNSNKRAVLKVKKWYPNRSLAENNYYWACIVTILADEFGYSKEEMHESLKSIFLKVETPGKPPKILSTSDLTTIEAEKYYEEIRTWASVEYKIRLMLPNEFID